MNDNRTQLPLQLPSFGGGEFRRQRQRRVALVLLLALLVLAVLVAGRPRVAPNPIANLQKNGVHGVYNLRSKKNELLIYNFRAVDPGRVYRASGFPRNHRGELGGKMGIYPAAYFDSEAFDFLRARNIRTVISLNPEREFYAEQGYFRANSKRTGYKILLINWPVNPQRTYARDKREKSGALRAAINFIDYLKQRDPRGGAVLVHGEAGKDAVGVVAAAYELWRNVGHGNPDELWRQIRERYAVSDVLIKRDKDARKAALSGKQRRCKDGKTSFACPENLDALRRDLELIAQVN
jgi:hypothetical protein